MNRPEILAPAGNTESLSAALRTGANAVYIGGKNFSARNNADNFSLDEISQAANLCHKYGAKLYLAVNTIISDNETTDFCDYIKSTAKIGVDGYIIQDLGAYDIIKKSVPDAVLHASTQMSVHTAVGVRMLKELGFARVVPARELSADTLEKICHEDIETEIFVHGALCMSVSGQCYMSAVMGSRSANRGCCGQACRLPFSAKGTSEYNALSLKDLSLIDHIDRIKSMGVDSLKIEGRMKRPEYVSATVNEFRKALDGETPDKKTLAEIFSRNGFTDGYFTADRKCMFGIRDKENSLSAKKIFPVIHDFYRSERPVHEADFFVEIKTGIPLYAKAVCSDISVEITDDVPDTAKVTPTDYDAVKKQLSKLGDTVFYIGKLTADIDNNVFVSAGKLNKIRRTVIEKLTEKLIEKNTPHYTITDYTPKFTDIQPEKSSENIPLRTFCRTKEQALIAVNFSEYIIIPMKIINKSLLEEIPAEKIIISPPRFILDEDKVISDINKLKNMGINRLICHTPDTVAIGRNLGMKLHGNFTLNIFNSFCAEFIKNLGLEDCIFSIEATLNQFRNIRTNLSIGAVVYGRLPLMLTRNCPVDNECGCGSCMGCITDRTSRKFPVVCSKDYCEILNSDTLYMFDRISEFYGISFGAVLLNDENSEQTKSVFAGRKPDGDITRGLYYRGVNI